MTTPVKLLTCFFACAMTHASMAQAPQISMEELAAVTPEFTAERDAATTYLRERPWYISRMSERCREILGMPPLPSSGAPEESRWQSVNHRYSTAAVRYRDKKSKHGDEDPFAQFKRAMEETRQVQKKVYAGTDAQLEASADRQQACRTFFTDSEEGKFDVTPADVHYETLEGLARELFDPPSPGPRDSAP